MQQAKRPPITLEFELCTLLTEECGEIPSIEKSSKPRRTHRLSNKVSWVTEILVLIQKSRENTNSNILFYIFKQKDIQLWSFTNARLLNKLYENEVILREQNLLLKYCLPLKKLIYLENGFRSFPACDIGSVDQRAAKLLAVIVGDLEKICCLAPFELNMVIGPNHSQSLTDGNFVALWPTEPISTL